MTKSPLIRSAGLLALVLAVAPASSDAAGDSCRTIPGPVQQVWTVSATQVGGDLLLADGWNQELLRFPLARGTFSRVEGPFSHTLDGFWPAAIHNAGGDLLLEIGGGYPGLVKLDRSLAVRPGSTRTVIGRANPDGDEIASTWIWQPLAGGSEVVSCSDVFTGGPRASADSYYTGILRFPYDDPGRFETLVKTRAAPPLRLACRLPLQLVTALGDTAYFWVPGPEPALYRQRAGADPERLATPPQLAGWLDETTPELTRSSFERVMRRVEDAAMPVGLFGWESSLYLLSRQPGQRGAVDWSLTRIDPDTGAAQGTMTIASNANHLLLAPGDDYWAAVEKGRVRRLGYQDLRGVLVIPADRIRSWVGGGTICGDRAPR